MLERETGLFMSFDDQTGFLMGVHIDVPAMNLDYTHLIHDCSFCLFAKKNPSLAKDCHRNKVVSNRLVIRSQKGLDGFCHLGLLDLAEPLVYQGKVLGVFYYGSVLVREQEKMTHARIRRYCARRKIDSKPYFAALKKITVIDAASIPRHQQALRTVVALAHHLCESGGVRADIYKTRKLTVPITDPEETPYIVQETIRYASTHMHESFNVKDLAIHLRCHPDFLSRKFKECTGHNLSTYVLQIRIDRAKHLLENAKIGIKVVAEQSGFPDRAHFSKVFRRMTGVTPGQYQKNIGVKAT